jgi:hypothetical protein
VEPSSVVRIGKNPPPVADRNCGPRRRRAGNVSRRESVVPSPDVRGGKDPRPVANRNRGPRRRHIVSVVRHGEGNLFFFTLNLISTLTVLKVTKLSCSKDAHYKFRV